MKTEEIEKGLEVKTVSAYELQRLFQGLASVVERMPMVLSRELDETAGAGIQDAVSRMARCLESIKTFEETLNTKQSEICDHFDKLWQEIKGQHGAIAKKIDALPDLAEVKIPYGLKDIIGLAVDNAHLKEHQWKKVIELAKAMK